MNLFQKEQQTTKQTRIKRYASTNACLAMILARLYAGERLSIKALALECEVSLRTMQRYVNERLTDFPIDKKGDMFSLSWDGVFENLDTSDQTVWHILKAFSRQQGTKFYQKAQKFLSTFSKRIDHDQYHFPSYLNPTDNVLKNLHLIQQAIEQKRTVKCRYKKDRETYTFTLQPLKILNFGGHWYLAALSNEKLKKYRIDKCAHIALTDKTFTISESLETALAKTASIWFDPHRKPFEVRLFIDKSAAEFFENDPINPTQIITGKDRDGSIEVALQITHDMEIVPIVKQWLPHLRILSPERLDTKIKKEIESYIVET